jgi:toxin ParE1/3/4
VSGVSYVLTPSAKADLEEIWRFIAEDNPEEADKLETDIYDACEVLARHPEMGSQRPAWTSKPVRS